MLLGSLLKEQLPVSLREAEHSTSYDLRKPIKELDPSRFFSFFLLCQVIFIFIFFSHIYCGDDKQRLPNKRI
jgi:hypothetical protein